MSAKHTKRQSRKQLGDIPEDRSDWERVDRLTEQELERAIAEDPDADIASPDWTRARLVIPRRKESIHIRLDPDVLEWFRGLGKGYQTRINAVLRAYMEAHRRRRSAK